ncbi:MAG: ankyrin repeat domain-containing protein [Acidobacteriota bacterium]
MKRFAIFLLAAGIAFPQSTALKSVKPTVNTVDPDGTTALHWAVRNNDLQLAAKLIKAGANVKAENRYRITPLYLASENGSPEMLKLLLKAGADPNATVNLQESALMTAARTGNVAAAKVLLDAGAKVDAREGMAQPDRTDVGGCLQTSRNDGGVNSPRRGCECSLEDEHVGTPGDGGASR